MVENLFGLIYTDPKNSLWTAHYVHSANGIPEVLANTPF